jgi:hypothetical protein
MDRELIQDYLRRAEMNEVQSEALSRILAQMATKDHLLVLEEKSERRFGVLEERFERRFGVLEERFERRFGVLEEKFERRLGILEAGLEGQMARLGAEIKGEMAQLRADLTWRLIALIIFFGTVITVLNAFVG